MLPWNEVEDTDPREYIMSKLGTAVAACVAFIALPAVAGDYNASLNQLAVDRLAAVAQDPVIVDAIKAQNEAHSSLTEAEILELDGAWREQVGGASAPLVDRVLGNEAAARLAEARDASEGLLTEVFVMDDKGLNVAASDATSDYWQGDEAKWIETYKVGAQAIHIGDVELDESTQSYQAQVSMTIVDPETDTPIGAATFGVDIEYLQ